MSDVIHFQATNTALDAPERFRVSLGDGDIAGWRWRNPGAAPLLFCHANGFCASTYKQVLQPLARQFDIYAIDLRGHGRTTLPATPTPDHTWRIFAADIGAFLDTVSGQEEIDALWTLAGHSLGAASSILAAVGRTDVKRVIAIEPVAVPPVAAAISHLPFWHSLSIRTPMAKGAFARRSHWSDAAATHASYASKPIFKRWAPGVLSDYLEDGLRAVEDGVTLSCAPGWEAANFAARDAGFWRAVRSLDAPLSVLGAAHKSTTLFAGGKDRMKRAGAYVTLARDVTHLAPMENPALAADFIASSVLPG
ncbi:MAG: alpha/beta hydrolase [Pseudomonadota bacterium]